MSESAVRSWAFYTPCRRFAPTLSAHPGDKRVGDLEIGVDVLHVVMFVEEIDQLDQLLAGFVVDGDGILRLPDQGRLAGLAKFRLEALGDLAKGFLRGVDF